MKAQNLNIAELIEFSKGFVGLQGRRLLIHDLSSMGQFRRDLIDSVGNDGARHILTRMGFFWGQADAAAMQRLFQWDGTEEWIKACVELIMISGMASSELSVLDFNESAGVVESEIRCTNSNEVEQHCDERGASEVPICWVIAGYLSGYFSYCIGKNVYFLEELCQAAGAGRCVFRGKDIDTWGKDAEKRLSFFHAVDIQKKVRDLTRRIRSQQRAIALQRKLLSAATSPADSLNGVAIRSKSFRNVMELANRVAAFNTTVLVTGETGTGKEVLSRHIHACSPRRDAPFIAVNCSALPENLLESELFGHRAGSFTGAHADHKGLFESAENGTIFLDEIGDISPAIQARLLRCCSQRKSGPLGKQKPG